MDAVRTILRAPDAQHPFFLTHQEGVACITTMCHAVPRAKPFFPDNGATTKMLRQAFRTLFSLNDTVFLAEYGTVAAPG